MDIKKHAQAIVKECERVERVKKSITELSRGYVTQINLRLYISQGNRANIDVWITENDLPIEAREAIKNVAIRKLQESIDN
jgi:hypothetical protein